MRLKVTKSEKPKPSSVSVEDGTQKTPRSGRKYNPYWYVQPRDGGKWSTVSIKRDSKDHLSSWGTGETSVSLDMGETDKRYVEKAFGMKAANLAEFIGETFSGALHKNSQVSMASRYFPSLMDNAMVTVVRMECKSPQLSTTLRVSNYLDGSPPKFEVSYMELPYNDQAQGMGKDALRKFVALADNIGADRISLLANIDVGGYAWARYGFVPTPAAWKDLSVAIRKSLMKADFKGNPEASEIVGHVKTLTAPNSDPRNIRAIAGLTVPVSHPVLGDTKLGWSLLRGTFWQSEAHLNDKETLAHIQATCRKEESFDTEDWDRIVSTTKPTRVVKASGGDYGAFFMSTNTGRRDDMIHKYMLPAGSFVADQVAVRQLMSIGMSRADARRFIGLQRGYGG